MKDLNFTLKSYIQGQVTVSVILGVILYIGYTIIGLPYTPLLVLFAGVANLIPSLRTMVIICTCMCSVS